MAQRKFKIGIWEGAWINEEQTIEYHSINQAEYRVIYTRWGKTICSDCGRTSHEAGDDYCFGKQKVSEKELQVILANADWYRKLQ